MTQLLTNHIIPPDLGGKFAWVSPGVSFFEYKTNEKKIRKQPVYRATVCRDCTLNKNTNYSHVNVL